MGFTLRLFPVDGESNQHNGVSSTESTELSVRNQRANTGSTLRFRKCPHYVRENHLSPAEIGGPDAAAPLHGAVSYVDSNPANAHILAACLSLSISAFPPHP
jgi:hypothetical protein